MIEHCALFSVEFGSHPDSLTAWRAAASSSTSAAQSVVVESWSAVEVVDAASQALVAEDPADLRRLLAAHVEIQAVGESTRTLTREDAIEQLSAWRATWLSCTVLIAEMLMSGPFLAATGFVVGLAQDGTPSCIDLRLIWREAH